MRNRLIKIEKRAKDVYGFKHKRHKVIAFCLDKQFRILSFGENSFEKTHPKQKLAAHKVGNDHRIYLHAEMQAILRARSDIYAIYIARFDKNGSPKLAKPCPMCELAILEAGIKKVMYTVEND